MRLSIHASRRSGFFSASRRFGGSTARGGDNRRATFVFLFVLLLCVSVAEHRLAEFDIEEWDPDVAVENDDGFDADEICGKLTLVDDVPRPVPPLIHEAIDYDVPFLKVAPRGRLVIDRSDPRAPPRPPVVANV